MVSFHFVSLEVTIQRIDICNHGTSIEVARIEIYGREVDMKGSQIFS